MYKFIICILVFLILFLGFKKVLADDVVLVPIDPLFERISYCESHGDLHAKSHISSASGEFQFLNSSWYHYGKEYWGEDFYSKNIWSSDNRDLAWYVYKKYGTRDWLASAKCWSVL